MNEMQSQNELNRWLKNYSIDNRAFDNCSTELLRAQITARGNLDNYAHFLTQEQALILKAYCCDFANPFSRKFITENQIHQVLNIGSKVRRKKYKQNKSFN